jgi:hypothetical protein
MSMEAKSWRSEGISAKDLIVMLRSAQCLTFLHFISWQTTAHAASRLSSFAFAPEGFRLHPRGACEQSPS